MEFTIEKGAQLFDRCANKPCTAAARFNRDDPVVLVQYGNGQQSHIEIACIQIIADARLMAAGAAVTVYQFPDGDNAGPLAQWPGKVMDASGGSHFTIALDGLFGQTVIAPASALGVAAKPVAPGGG